MLFHDDDGLHSDIYKKLLSDKLETDMGYLFENSVAQILAATDRDLYYHTWKKPDSSHHYEIDFLTINNHKVIPIEVKSSSVKKHTSLDQFAQKYSQYVGEQYLISQKDVSNDHGIKFRPIYMLPFYYNLIFQEKYFLSLLYSFLCNRTGRNPLISSQTYTEKLFLYKIKQSMCYFFFVNQIPTTLQIPQRSSQYILFSLFTVLWIFAGFNINTSLISCIL